MSANESSQINPPASPQTPRVTFRTQSTPNTNTSTIVYKTQTSLSPDNRDIELSREEIFEQLESAIYEVLPRGPHQQGCCFKGNPGLCNPR